MAVAQELYILEFGCDALNSATMVIGQSCLHVIYSAKCSIVFAGFEFLKTEFLFFFRDFNQVIWATSDVWTHIFMIKRKELFSKRQQQRVWCFNLLPRLPTELGDTHKSSTAWHVLINGEGTSIFRTKPNDRFMTPARVLYRETCY